MIKSILLPLTEGNLLPAAREFMFWLAQKEGSRVHALAVIDVKSYEMPVLGTPDGFMPSVVTPPIAQAQTILDELTAAARERLDQFARDCNARSIPLSTDLKTGIPGEVVCREAVAHDIVVMARSGYTRIPSESPERVDSLVQSVIRGSIRPVLVAGQAFHSVNHVVVAYDGSVHAGRALLAAAELASRPEVRCTLVNIAHSEEIGAEILAPAEAFLYHHGVKPQSKVVVGAKPSELICGVVASEKADLLVMGAYGHRAIREMIFGSTTERVLSHCGVPVVLQS